VPGGSLFEAPAVTFRGVLLLLAVLCSALPSSAVEAPSVPVAPTARQADPGVPASPFGIPFPVGRDPQAWQAWRERVRAELEARHNRRTRANNAGATGGGIIETIAGAVPFQKPVNALKTGFGYLQGIAEDSSRNLYLASCDLGVILKIDSSSNTTVYAGQPLSVGPAVSTGDGGPATAARLPCPTGLAIDSQNNLYITDIFASTVREVNGQTGIIQTIAGTPGQSGHSGDGGPATSAQLEYPIAVTLDGAGNLYIADLEYVREVNLASGMIRTIAGIGSQPPQCWLSATNTCPATQVNLSVTYQSLRFAKGRLYAAPGILSVGSTQTSGGETGGIVTIDPSSGTMQLLAGGGSLAGTSSIYPAIGLQLEPEGIAVDSVGDVFISGRNQTPGTGTNPQPGDFVVSVDELSAADHVLRVVAGSTSNRIPNGDGGAATKASLRQPQGICLSPAGDVVFIDFPNIRSFPVGGTIQTIAGNGTVNFFGDGGPALNAGLDGPSRVTSDQDGNIYVVDEGNGRVRRIDAVTGEITTVAGGGQIYGTAADGGSALQAGLAVAYVAVDHSGHLYLQDYQVGIRVVDLKSGTISTLLSLPLFGGVMVFDGNKTLYFAVGDGSVELNPTVAAVDITSGATTQIAGGSHLAPTGDGGPATQAGLYDVEGLALDEQGNLYLADHGFENIRKVNPATGIISTIAGVHPDSPYGSGYSGDGGPAIAATFHSPAGLAYDGAGHLTIVDSGVDNFGVLDFGNNVLRQIDLTTGIINTIAGNHVPGLGGDGGSPAAAMLYDPLAAAYDPAGNLFIADMKNDRVRRILLHPTALSSRLNYEPSGDGITLTATYSGLSFGFAPRGTVTFLNGSIALGTGTMAAATDGSGNYVATVTSTSLPADSAAITAQYSGDVHYATATTTIAFQQLGPSYTISANPASLTVKQGSSGSITFTVTPLNGFNQAVSFSCDSTTLPKGVACSFAPASVTPNGSGAVTTTLTVQTTGSGVAALNRRTTPFPDWLPRGGSMLALLLLGVPRVRRRVWLGGAALMLFALCLTGMLGCGGGGTTSGSGGTQNANVTPPGSYSIQVTTLAGSASGAAPLTVSLTVTQ
jgi:sugar lactone lactonase YvrE